MLEELIKKTEARRKADALRYKKLDSDLCMLCHAYGQDKRSLFISCFYAIEESVPEAIDLSLCGDGLKERGYYLRLCKSCRSSLLEHLEEWANKRRDLRGVPKDHDGDLEDDAGGGAFVRIYGAVRKLK